MFLVKASLVAVFLIMISIDVDAGWFGRRRRRSSSSSTSTTIINNIYNNHKSKGGTCVPVCFKFCPIDGDEDEKCYFPCTKMCNGKAPNLPGKDDVIVVPLGRDFKDYDLNKDNALELKEVAMTVGVTEKEADDAFGSADTDGDGSLTRDEFQTAPWYFREEDDKKQ